MLSQKNARVAGLAALCAFLVSALTGCPLLFTGNQAGSVFLSATPATGPAPLQVMFTGTSILAPPYQTQAWNWDFGDGTTGEGRVVNHCFQQPGTYDVTLSVSVAVPKFRGEGEYAPATLTATRQVVAINPNQPPVADAGPDQSVFIDSFITLDGSGSYDPDEDPITYAWTFLSVPAGSEAALAGADTVAPTFTADRKGDYEIQLVVNDGQVDSAPDTVVVTVENRPPLADAGPDQAVFLGDVVTLDGTGSSDPDDDPLTYFWEFINGPTGSEVSLSGQTTANPTFTPDMKGTYTIELVVSDGEATDSDTVVVTVMNRPPVADAGDDQETVLDTPVTLDGSGSSDPDSDPLTFDWSILSAPTGSTASLTGADTVSPTLTPDAKGVYEIELVVNDGEVDSAPDTMVVTVLNRPPVADAGDNQETVLDTPVTLDGSGSSDPDSDPLTFDWSILSSPPGSTASLAGADTVSPTLTPDARGDYVIELVVNDGEVDSAPDTVVVTVVNRPPVADAGEDQTTYIDMYVMLDGSGSYDPDSDPLTFDWTIISSPTGSAPFLTGEDTVSPMLTLDMKGVYEIRLIVNDGFVDSAPDTVIVTVENRPPVADAGQDQSGYLGTDVTLDGSFSYDPDGDPLAYDWDFTSRPAGSTASLTGADTAGPTFTPDLKGVYEIELVVNDGEVDSGPDTVVVTIENRPPVAIGAVTSTNEPTAEVYRDTESGGIAPNLDTLYGLPRRGEGDKAFDYAVSLLQIDPTNANIVGEIPITVILDGGGYLLPVDVYSGRGLAVDPITGEVWAILGGYISAEPWPGYIALCRINPYTGVAVPVGDPIITPLSDLYAGLAADDADGLYGVTGNDQPSIPTKFVDTNHALYGIDKTTTLDTFLIQFPETTENRTPGEVIAFNTDDGLMYHATGDASDEGPDRQFNSVDLDQIPLAVTPLAITPGQSSWSRPTAMTYAPGTSQFYLADYIETSELFRLTVSAGTVTEELIGTIAPVDGYFYRAVKGLAFLYEPQFPAPLVTLDGSQSYDLDGDDLTYAWTFTSVPQGSTITDADLSDPTGVSPSFTPDVLGTYELELVVNDGEVDSAPATVTVAFLNQAPVADAGDDQLVPDGYYYVPVQLNGGDSYDPDGNELTFAWTFLTVPTGSTLTDANINTTDPAPSFYADAASLTEPYQLQLTVTDADGATSTDTVQLFVEPGQGPQVQ